MKHQKNKKNNFTQILIGVQIIILMILAFQINSINSTLKTMSINNPTENAVEVKQPTAQPNPTLPSSDQKTDMVKLADDDPFKGNENAPVTIIEWSDFECPFCSRFYSQTLGLIEKDYINTGKVKLVYRDFPLSFHQNAQKAAEAAECADDQGKFWEMHDLIFENQQILSVDNFKQWASNLGLNTEEFNNCLDSGKYTSEIQNDIADGTAAGIRGTPGFIINGRLVSGAQPYTNFESAIEAALNDGDKK